MSNNFYTPSGAPVTGSSGSSSVVRAEFSLLEQAFDKFPALTGNANKVVVVNSASTALTAVDSLTLQSLSATTGTFGAGTAASPSLTTTGDTDTGVFFPAANTLALGTAGLERVRVDSAGNLGLGVTPSAWGAQRALEFAYGGLSIGGALGVQLVANSFYNGTNWIYRVSSSAHRYEQDNAGHKFFTAPSGTAGNTISFTQVMTLTSAGDLLVGATSRLVNFGREIVVQGPAGQPEAFLALRGSRSIADQNIGGVTFYNDTTQIASIIATRTNANDSGALRFTTSNAGSNTERARITSGGNLLVGTTVDNTAAGLTPRISTSGSLLGFTHTNTSNISVFANAAGGFVGSQTVLGFAVGTNLNEAARITSAGNLLVGTTAGPSRLHIVGGALNSGGGTGLGISSGLNGGRFVAGSGVVAIASSTDDSTVEISAGSTGGQSGIAVSGAGGDVPSTVRFFANNTERARITSGGNFLFNTTTVFQDSPIVVNGTGRTSSIVSSINGTALSTHIQFQNGNGVVGSITTNGNTTAYNTTSDHRLKTLIAKVTDAGSRLDALNPVEYEWKSDGKRTRGFFAHEFQEVYADSVTGQKDAVDAEGKPVYQSMQASSSEVIADLVAEIQSLRARVAALENA